MMIIIIIFIRYVRCKWIVLFLSHWMAARLGQTGGGGGLAFLLPKDSIKASFLHHCGGERERDAHIFIRVAAAAAERRRRAVSDFTSLTACVNSHNATLIFKQSWYTMIRPCISSHLTRLGECIGSGGFMIVMHVCNILHWSIIRHMHCKKATQMAWTFMHVVQLMWRDWNWSWVCATLLWWSLELGFSCTDSNLLSFEWDSSSNSCEELRGLLNNILKKLLMSVRYVMGSWFFSLWAVLLCARRGSDGIRRR